MCIVCILFLLAVHRLVLIVNSWDVFWGNRRQGEEESCPHTTETVFLLRPDESFRICFCFICIFPELEESRGECFCKAEGQEELRTMTKRKITFPLEEKNKKKSMAVLSGHMFTPFIKCTVKCLFMWLIGRYILLYL